MADFTHYSQAAPEWARYQAQQPPPPSPQVELSHEQRKGLFNGQKVKAFNDFFGEVGGVTVKDIHIPTSDGATLAARLYEPETATAGSLPLYIHLHSGGFYLGNLETEDTSCRLLSIATSSAVLNVDYRHTPDWPFPTPMQDTFDTIDWVFKEAASLNISTQGIIVGGVSAGASLACAAALRENDESLNRLGGLILTVPPTVYDEDFPRHLLKDGYSSLEQNVDAPILPKARRLFFQQLYKPDRGHPYTSPLLLPEGRFQKFPPTCLHIAGLDPLRDEGLLFADKLTQSGVKTQLKIYSGFPHAFMNVPNLEESEKWRQDLYNDIKWLRSQISQKTEVVTAA